MKITERNSIKFDIDVEGPQKSEVKAAKPVRAFGEDGYFYFKGTRTELREFIRVNNPELYEKAFIYTVKGSTRDWFEAMSSEFIYNILRPYGFNWENVYTTLVLKDTKENNQ